MGSRHTPKAKTSALESGSRSKSSSSSSKKKKNEEEWIEFNPSDVDVVSTKIRTWNSRHPANIYYTELVRSRSAELPSAADGGENSKDAVSRITAEIVDELTTERGGRFLKLKEGDLQPTHCVVMDKRQIRVKVMRALREFQAKRESGVPLTPIKYQYFEQSPKKKKYQSVSGDFFDAKHRPDGAEDVQNKDGKKSKKQKSSKGRTDDDEVQECPPSPSIIYSVNDSAASKPLDDYMKMCISTTCNFSNPEEAYKALDYPLSYSLEAEPDKLRIMRLQLRHRYVAAVTAGMTAIEFSERLLALWGCTLQAHNKSSFSQQPQQSTNDIDLLPIVGRLSSSPQASNTQAEATPFSLPPMIDLSSLNHDSAKYYPYRRFDSALSESASKSAGDDESA